MRGTMPISRYERKERLPFGAQKEIAEKLDLAESTVSLVVNDKVAALNAGTVRKVRVAVARRIGLPVDQVFQPELAGTAA